MMFGRKKRPSQLEGGQAPSSIAHRGAADEDDDIIELVDIIEIPEDHEAEEDLLGLSDAALDADYPKGVPPDERDGSAIAAILEDNQAEILEDDEDLDAGPFLADQQEQPNGLGQESERLGFDRDAFAGGEFAESEDLETDETLMEEADTDRLISELMASHRDEEAEEGGVLVEEYEEEVEQAALAPEDNVILKDWDDAEVLTDVSVESEPAIAESDEGLGQLLEETFGQDLAPADEMLAMTAVEATAISVAVEHLLEEEAPVSAHQEEPDVRLMGAESELSFGAKFEAEVQDGTADAHDGTVLPGEPFTVAKDQRFLGD